MPQDKEEPAKRVSAKVIRDEIVALLRTHDEVAYVTTPAETWIRATMLDGSKLDIHVEEM